MNFELTEDQRAFAETARQFAEAELAPHAAKWDAEASEPLRAGDTAWVTGFSGIVLRVSSRPGSSRAQ